MARNIAPTRNPLPNYLDRVRKTGVFSELEPLSRITMYRPLKIIIVVPTIIELFICSSNKKYPKILAHIIWEYCMGATIAASPSLYDAITNKVAIRPRTAIKNEIRISSIGIGL